MKRNDFKTILFASLIAAMILPFSGMQVADAGSDIKYEPHDIKIAFEKADFYITQDEDYILHFDHESASSKMSEHEIQITMDFVALQNGYVDKVHDNPNTKHAFDEKLDERFSKLKDQIKEGKSGKVTNVDTLSNWILPEAFAWSDVCGGSFDNPHPEYIRMQIHDTSSKAAAIAYVEADGYHEVGFYASNPFELLNSNLLDYGKEISAYNCNFGAFRDQIVLTYENGVWELGKQIDEPNPEFLDYDHPAWWWVWYTFVWHDEEIGTPTEWDP